MTRRSRLCWCLLLLGTASCSGLRKPLEDDLDAGPVADFILGERGGEKVSSEKDLRDKVWVASFIFTRCTTGCPQVTATMARLQGELRLADTDDLRLVTFTVDPKRDGPDDLKRYAEHYKAHPKRWLFLTCESQKEMHELIQKGFKLAVAEKPEERKKPGDEFEHATKLVVVDRRGHIRGFHDGMPRSQSEDPEKEFEAELSKLKKRVAELLREKPR